MKGLLDLLRGLFGRVCPGCVEVPEAQQRDGANVALQPWIDTKWLAQRRASSCLFAEPDAAALAQLADEMPARVAKAVAAARRVMRHEFDLLGSGAYSPVPPEWADGSVYRAIDWNFDPVSGLRFPSGIHHKQWDLWKMRPGMADIKLPWELARCQHLPVLAQAWRLTGEACFADEIFAELADFDAANPVGFGIHWTCTMDVAIRAANWALALEMIRGYAASETQWIGAYRSLYAHGDFIRSNLEDKYEVTSNHYLSNVIGLYYLAQVFHGFAQAEEWDRFSRAAIEREIDVQILPDGADFESSVPYHRLVAELFLGAVAVAERSGKPFSGHLKSTLHKMIDFLFAVLRPDGLMPQLGDADDGRLHILTDYGCWQPQDARHLLASGACILGVPEWRGASGEAGRWEAFWWSGGAESDATETVSLPNVARHFPDAGIVVDRSQRSYLAITNGIVGTKGFGNHKHNDLLSFEFHQDGVALIVDPGSYVYTSDLAARNLFRGTGYHNTLMVDETEQNESNPEWIFRLFEKADPETLEHRVNAESMAYRGRHRGYTRLADPVVHERSFLLAYAGGDLTIIDRLEGSGRHRLRWHFHLAPGVGVEIGEGAITLVPTNADTCWRLSLPAGLAARSEPAWYSPSYGVRVPCRAIELETEVVMADAAEWTFTLTRIGAEK